MEFKPDPKIDLADAEQVSLGGHRFFVPRLMLRQTKKIGPHLPTIIRLLTRISEAGQARAKRLKGHKDKDAPFNADELERLVFSEAEIDTMTGIVHVALSRAYPTLTREQLEDLPISVNELAAALPVAALQSRTITKAGEGQQAGEGEAASQ